MKARACIASAMVLFGAFSLGVLSGGCSTEGDSAPQPSASGDGIESQGASATAGSELDSPDNTDEPSGRGRDRDHDHDHDRDHDHDHGHDLDQEFAAIESVNGDPVTGERPSREEALSSRWVDLMEVPSAPVEVDLGESRFAGQSGFDAPNDPEAEFIRKHGRREAPWIDGELMRGVEGFDNLIDALLIGLRDGEPNALMDLQLTEADYRRYCWPEFPQSRPVTKIPVGESWFFLERKAYSGVQRGMQDYGGQALTPTRVYFREGRVEYENFTLFKGMVIAAQGPGGGAETLIDFCPIVIERNGRWNVYTFED